MNWIDALGTGGALMFAASCIPLAWKTWRQGKGLGTPLGTVWMFTGATVLFTTYLALKVGAIQGPTLISGSEAVAWLVVLFYEYFPRQIDEITGSKWEDFFAQVDVRDHPLCDHMGCGPRYHGGACRAYYAEDLCIRPHHETGPCNGYPRRDCPMTATVQKEFYPD